jgi:hypothetical protein
MTEVCLIVRPGFPSRETREWLEKLARLRRFLKAVEEDGEDDE